MMLFNWGKVLSNCTDHAQEIKVAKLQDGVLIIFFFTFAGNKTYFYSDEILIRHGSH